MTSIRDKEKLSKLSFRERWTLFIIVKLIRSLQKTFEKKGMLVAFMVAGNKEEKKRKGYSV